MEHRLIPDSERHEPKGASTATAGQVVKSNGNGTTSFGFVDWEEIVNKPTASVNGYNTVLTSGSNLSQVPTSQGNPLQVSFGAAITGADVSLSTAGNLTFNTTGNYLVKFDLLCGAPDPVEECVLVFRTTVNDEPIGPLVYKPCTASNTVYDTVTIISNLNLAEGDVVKLHVARTSIISDYGGLYAPSSTVTGWDETYSAHVSVSLFGG